MDTKCRSCLYHGSRTDTCDYYLMTGQRRGCPVTDCIRYVGMSQADESEIGKEFSALYEQGCSDSEISRMTGRSRWVVARWREKMGLPSQREIEVSSRDG